MKSDTKLIYNSVFIPEEFFNNERYHIYTNSVPELLEYEETFTHDKEVRLLVGNKYVLGAHHVLSLLNGWIYISTMYNVYHIRKKVEIIPSQGRSQLYEAVEVDFFYADTQLDFFDRLYDDT